MDGEPADPQALFETASAFDAGGRPDLAAPRYEQALAAGLAGDRRWRALVQYGSTLRNLDRPGEAVAVLRQAVDERPDSAATRAFLALALLSAHQADYAVADLVDLVLDRVSGEDVERYRRSLRRYAAALRRGYWSAASDDGRVADAVRTERLVLRPIDPTDLQGIVAGERRSDWAVDFPAAGDLELAALLQRTGLPGDADRAFGHRLVVERSSAQLVGAAGFFGPPRHGRVEIGYGIVPSRRRRGYATEAILGLVTYAFARPEVIEIVACTEPENVASARVLEKAGFTRGSGDGESVSYRLTRVGTVAAEGGAGTTM